MIYLVALLAGTVGGLIATTVVECITAKSEIERIKMEVEHK